MGKEIIISYKNNSGEYFVAKPMKLEFEKVDPSKVVEEPTLRIGVEFSEDFFPALAAALDSQGIKTENDHKIQGLLEAKESHLQDMRKLVFENKT